MSTYTFRELVATTINSSATVRSAGLAPNQIWDADTVDSPDSLEFPFIVVRWGTRQPGLGRNWRHPFSLWGYTQSQDRTEIEKLIATAMRELTALQPQPKFDGFFLEIKDSGQGDDLWDESYQAMVVPRSGTAVGSGV